MSEDSKIGTIVCLVIAAALAAVGVMLSFFPVKIETNTVQDEPKVMELTKELCVVNPKFYFDYNRDLVIKRYYSKEEVRGFDRLATKVLLIISIFPALIGMLLFLMGFMDGLGLKSYFSARAEYWKKRGNKESELPHPKGM